MTKRTASPSACAGIIRHGRTCVCLALVLACGTLSCRDTNLEGGGTLVRDIAALPVNECPQPDPNEFPVRINEVLLMNESVLADENGLFPAWIELLNVSDHPLDLGGAFLSDDILDSEKWQIPCVPEAVLEAGGFAVIFMDGDQNPDDLHASFVPPIAGTLTFILNTGADIIEIDADLLATDVSAGRAPDGAVTTGVLLAPTPGAPNSVLAEDLVPKFVRGDADESGDVSDEDVGALVAVLGSMQPLPACPDRLDVNDDGLIDIGDASFLALSLSPGGPSISAPFPAPGIDPTPDTLPPCEAAP